MKGFTLIDLLASLLIFSIITLLATATFQNSYAKTEDIMLDAKIKMIETAAERWISDNNIFESVKINVERLIEEGYLENDTFVELKCDSINITYDLDEPLAFYEKGKC